MTSLNQRITSLENNSGTGTGTGTVTIASVESLQSTLDAKQSKVLSVAFRVEISNASILKNTNILNQNNVIVSFNIGSGYHTTGVCMGTFVAPEAGFYSFYGKVRLPDNNTTAIEIQFYKKTGTDTDPAFTAYESFEYWINDSAKRRNGGASCFAYLNIGEGITIRNDNVGAISSGCYVVFHGFKVGE